ncbi:Homeobox-leucine zipper protein ATHB-52 [Bienertia sinuspersici]
MYSSKNFHTKKQHTQPKCTSKRLTEDQVRLLEASFKLERKLDTDRKFHLAQELGIPARQVAIWYQNKRARWKSQSLEMGYTTLQQKLDNALLENERLKQELAKVRQMLVDSTSSSTSYVCDEEGNSDLIIGEPSGCVLQNELYACLIGGHKGRV